MTDHTRPDSATREEEAREAAKDHSAGREADPQEAEAAEGNDVAPETEAHYEEMRRRGATQPGEGRLP